MSSYCEAIRSGKLHPVHKDYHDTEYGFPIEDDGLLFERLILEINQAGLSWETILKRKAGFREVYDGFDIQRIANYTEQDRERLLGDERIIRNKLKVNAAIVNAQKVLELQVEHGSFKAWLDHNHPLSREEWTKLFRKTFKFTGGEIVNEFLMSTGYLPGAHDEDCEVGREVLKLNPAWVAVS